jgi:D-amino-acid dehydrogenase
MRSAIVLGGGMVGVATALHLQRRGWSVVLVDRNEPGRETSYGNTGIIQGEAVRPYAMPRDLASLVRIAAGRTNDVRYRLLSLPYHLRPLLQYWRNSAPARHERITAAYAPIITHAVREHDIFIREAGAGNLVQRGGFHLLHREQAALDAAVAVAESLRAAYGVKFQALTADGLVRAEPGLMQAGAGAIHWQDSWTVSDPGGLVTAYAALLQSLGGTIVRGDAATLTQTSFGWSVRGADGQVDAEAAVVALGPWSPELLRQLGYRFPLVRKRGYHQHYAGGTSLQLPLVDASFGYAMAPMTRGMRITTGAEFTGPDAPPTPVQLGRAETAARQLVDLGRPVERDPWYGTRPCTPDMLPVIGQAPRHRGLWMNFGHGHQGFTLGPVTGRLLAELMNGEPTDVDTFPYRPDRF